MSGPARISTTAQFARVSLLIMEFPKHFDTVLLLQLLKFGPEINAKMKAGVPNHTGKRQREFRKGSPRPAGGLKSLLTWSIDEKDLRLRAGLLSPAARSDGFYGYILDAGRGLKRQRSRTSSRLLGTAPSLVRDFKGGRRNIMSKRYDRRISPISPERYSIAFGAVRIWARAQIGPMLGKAFDAAKANWANGGEGIG